MAANSELIEKYTIKASKKLGVSYELIEDKLQFLRMYDNLMCMVGEDEKLARHWIYSKNNHLRYAPILRVHQTYYLKQINEYLEAFRYR
jgi:hypothetical protein